MLSKVLRILVVFVVIAVLSGVSRMGFAVDATVNTEMPEEAGAAVEPPKAAPVQMTKEQLTELEERRVKEKKAKDALEGTEWDITLKEMGKAESQQITDVIKFQGSTISSEYLLSKGFTPTNFTVRVKRDTRVVWETMQTSEKNGVAFWRGELDRNEKTGEIGTSVRGVLSWHIKEKEIKDFSYNGTKGVAVAAEPEAAEVEKAEVPVEMAIPVAEQVETASVQAVEEVQPIAAEVEKAMETVPVQQEKPVVQEIAPQVVKKEETKTKKPKRKWGF